jgi:UDP-N-acetylmuramyl pentapeptide phosphotransferase/UDP-N-acetylglucosamine-1-phosphate transferase
MDIKANDGVVSAKANAHRALCRSQNPPVRFWIITMMLCLVGLSTLKLR